MSISPQQVIHEFLDMQWSWNFPIDAWWNVDLLLFCVDSQVDVSIDLLSAGSQLRLWVLSGGKNTTISLRVQLSASMTKADVHMVSLVRDDATIQVDGNILIGQGIADVEWYLLEEQLVLGERVSIKTLPMLDVRSNSVKASHGARIEKLDQQKLFYLMSKGLEQAQAQQLVIQGVIDQCLGHFSIENQSRFRSIDRL